MKKLILVGLVLTLAGCNYHPFTQTAHVNIVTACLTNGGYVTQVYTTKEGHVAKGDVLWE